MQFLRICLVLIVGIGLIVISVSTLYADETSESILKILIKKGIISQKEVNEMKAELAKEKAPEPKALEERVAKLEKQTPDWIKNTKFKGDLRLRNEYIANDQGQDNNRQRVRFRLGADTEVNDKFKVGFGLASGSSDSPTSTNQTLEQEFQSKSIWLDYAYASYDPFDWLHLIGGQFKSPFLHTDMLWDSDIRFDGFTAKVNHDINPKGAIPTSAYLTFGYFPIDDDNTAEGDDIYLLATQLGTESKFADGYAKLKTGIAYYDFENFEGATAGSLAEERGTNTYVGSWSSASNNTATLANDFKVISPTAKLSFKDIFGMIDVPFGILGEYAHNTEPSDNNDAWRVGFWLGQEKVKRKKQWNLLWQYSRLEKDVFYDGFPDADFNHAGTDGKGWEIIFDYGLTDNLIFSIDYYNTEKISSSDSDQQIVQADLIFKF